MSPEVITAAIVATLVFVFVAYMLSAQQTAADRAAEIQLQQLATLQKIASIPSSTSVNRTF